MAQVKINNNVYTLIMGDLYANNFSSYMEGDIINLDNLDLPLRYKEVDNLFGWIARSFVVLLGDMQEENEEMEYAKEIAEIRSRMSSVDHLQKFMHEKGNDLRSIEIMNNFIEQMLVTYKKVFESDKDVSMGGR